MSNPKTTLPQYSQLPKLQEDLFSKGFCLNQLSSISITSSLANHPKFFKSSFTHLQSQDDTLSTQSQASLCYESLNFSLKHSVSTTKESTSTLKITPKSLPIQNLTLDLFSNKFEGTSSKTLKLEQTFENINFDLSLSSKKSLSLSSVFAFSSTKTFGGGVDMTYSFDSKEFLSRNLRLWYLKPDQRAVVTFSNNEKKGFRSGILQSSFWFRPRENFFISAFWKIGLEEKIPQSAFAAQVFGDDGRSVKFRFCDDGRAALCISSRINDMVRVLTTGQLNVLDAMHVQFSFKLKVNS